MASLSSLLPLVRAHQKEALAQSITQLEAGAPIPAKLFSEPLHPKTRRIGITGPPGVGKSTLIAHLCRHLIRKKRKVGVIMVDPTSALSGGALLGDRLRMGELSGHPKLFIRSLASRGASGGLSESIYGIMRLYEYARFDDIIIETVGAGQSELEISHLAQCVVLVLVPQLGDEIQGIKAGIMEMADVIALNRAEQNGAKEALRMLEEARQIGTSAGSKKEVPIIELKEFFRTGIDELSTSITRCHARAESSFADYVRTRTLYEGKMLALSYCRRTLEEASRVHVKRKSVTSPLHIERALLKCLKEGI